MPIIPALVGIGGALGVGGAGTAAAVAGGLAVAGAAAGVGSAVAGAVQSGQASKEAKKQTKMIEEQGQQAPANQPKAPNVVDAGAAAKDALSKKRRASLLSGGITKYAGEGGILEAANATQKTLLG